MPKRGGSISRSETLHSGKKAMSEKRLERYLERNLVGRSISVS